MITVIVGVGIILIIALIVRIADLVQTATRREIAIERRERWESRQLRS